MQVVSEFYANAEAATAFVQTSSKQEPTGVQALEDAPEVFSDEPYTGIGGKPGGVIGMLEVIEADFSRLESETTVGEAQEQKLFEQNSQDMKVSIAKAEALADQKSTDIKSLAADLENSKADLAFAQEGLAAAKDTYETLRPTCVSEGVDFQERLEQRAKEIEQLKTAQEILEQANTD